jgi:hypothetical protein
MTQSTAPKTARRRRAAMIVGALGALVMSSGLTLMVSASPASAANKVGICHATSSDSNPYVYISVDDNSVKLKGHLMHRQSPNKTWKSAGTFNGVPHAAGAAKGDLIGSFTDDQGVFHLYDGNVTAATCSGNAVVVEATADVDFNDPSCANKNVVSYDTVGTFVNFALTSGSNTPGAAVQVTATAISPATFSGGGTTQVFNHTYGPAVDLNAAPCATADATAVVDFVDPTCDNLNAATETPSGDHVTFAITSGSAAPGADIQVTATADAGHTFGDLTTKKVFTHHFSDALDLDGAPCVIIVNPPPAPDATAAVNFVDPTCDNSNEASHTTSGDHVTFAVTSGSDTPGAAVTVTATADGGHTFADLSTTEVFNHTYGDAVDLNAAPCVTVVVPTPPVPTPPVVAPPVITPPVITPPVVAPPTIVDAGLITPDVHSAQGLALLVGGLLMMVLAGGLGLRRPTARARS